MDIAVLKDLWKSYSDRDFVLRGIGLTVGERDPSILKAVHLVNAHHL